MDGQAVIRTWENRIVKSNNCNPEGVEGENID